MGAPAERGLTPQQTQAISARDVSVALSAGAGCGKTFVLTQKFLAALAPDPNRAPSPDDLRRLAAITFTERAAREMRSRVRGACRERLHAVPPEQADAWLELIRQLDTARISTIHSFCTSLLRSHAIEAGLNPQFGVLSQAQAETLRLEILHEELHRRLAERDPDVMELGVEFGLQRLGPYVLEMLEFRQHIDWDAWRSTSAAELVERWLKACREELLPRMLEALVRSESARTVLQIAQQAAPTNAVMQERLAVLRERLPRLAGAVDPLPELNAIRESAKVQGGGSAKSWPDAAAYEAFRTAAEKLREAIKGALETCELSREAALPAATSALRLLRVAGAVCGRYDARKEELAALDFDDLLIRARQLLRGPQGKRIRRGLAGQLRLLLVDEFQDTDPVQVDIVKALCDDDFARGKLFFVGDSKQSIYRFRGADPQVFRQLRADLPREGRLPLTRNFRSQPAILDFVNALFCDELGPDYEPLEAHQSQVTPPPAVEFLWALGDAEGANKEDEDGDSQSLRRREARWIARRLRALLDGKEPLVWDAAAAKQGRPAARSAAPGDVAILFRALSNVAVYEEALREYGVDYYLVGGHAFYAQQEVFDLLNLLRAIERPHDDLSLAGALRSGFFSLTDETLFWLAQHGEGLSAGLFVERLPPQLSSAEAVRARFAAQTLLALRQQKDRLPIAALIHEALARTGYDALLAAEFLGERKLANLRKLIDQARQFEASGQFALADFITQLAEFVARQPKEPLAATSVEGSNVVQLMTVHQAKGLEFPIVVVPDLGSPTRASGGAAAFSPQWGPVVRTNGPGGFRLYAQSESAEDRAELHRLLYVAATRAADYLILSSGLTHLGPSRGPWLQLLAQRFDLASGALRAELPADYRTPQVRVTAAPPADVSLANKAVRRDLGKVAAAAVELAEKGAGHRPPHLEPVPADPAGRRRHSFSRLLGRLHAPTPLDAPLDERRATAGGASALRLGTLAHDLLAEIDFAVRPNELETLVRLRAGAELAEDDPAADEIRAMLSRFLASPRADALRASQEVHRELEFLLSWPPDGDPAGAPYFEGFLDCLYRDAAGAWHLLDYKTNRVTPATLAQTAAEYELQMYLYATAAEQVLGTPPVEATLCFLRAGLEHGFTWSAADRRELRRQVSQAMRPADVPLRPTAASTARPAS